MNPQPAHQKAGMPQFEILPTTSILYTNPIQPRLTIQCRESPQRFIISNASDFQVSTQISLFPVKLVMLTADMPIMGTNLLRSLKV